MPNLGSSDTPVEGQSFGLPAGAELGEDNGDVVIKDSSGTIILRRNETASEWQFEGTDLTGINSIDASSATLESLKATDEATVGNAKIINKIIETNITDPDDLFEVDVGNRSHIIVHGSFVNVGGKPSHKSLICKRGGTENQFNIIDSYRENSFRNQLDDPTYSSGTWTFSSTGTDAVADGALVLNIVGQINNFTEL